MALVHVVDLNLKVFDGSLDGDGNAFDEDRWWPIFVLSLEHDSFCLLDGKRQLKVSDAAGDSVQSG